MSAIPVERTAGIYTFDFSNDETQVYGGNTGHIEIQSGIWGMVASDANADGVINTDDKQNNWMVEAGLSGYYKADFNLDSEVDNVDKNDYWGDAQGFNGQIPE